MSAADYLESLPYVDKTRIGAAGASFGGFMINWIAGHTQRFKALVSHDGVYDQRSMYGETEELWFPEWEFRGVPWQNPSLYEKWSPSNYVQNIRTPILIVQGELDFRVPTGQAFQLFSALQRRGVPSRLLYFPDEGHWVLKPQNSRFWPPTLESDFTALYLGLDGHSQVLWKRGTSPGWSFDCPVPSPDGRYLAFTVVTYESNAWMLENF